VCKVRHLSPAEISKSYPAPKKPKATNPLRFVDCVVVSRAPEGDVLITQRPASGLLKSQNELVCVETASKPFSVTESFSSIRNRLEEVGFCKPCASGTSAACATAGEFKHVFSHLTHSVTVWSVNLTNTKCGTCSILAPSKWIPSASLSSSGLTSAMIKTLKLVNKI